MSVQEELGGGIGSSKELVPSGVSGQVGGLDLWGNKIVSIKQETGQQLVEYGVVTLKNGEIIEMSYSDLTKLNKFTDAGEKGILKLNGGTVSIDTVMIGKIETKTRLEDAPIDLKPQNRDKHLKQRVLTHYEAEVNLDGKGWKTQDIPVDNGKEAIKKLVSNEDDIRKRVRQLKPVYKMEYVKEVVDGKELLVERKQDHHYPDIPLTRITEYGDEVVMWYWAKPLNQDGKGKPKVGYKKIIELHYDENVGDYVRPRMLDACSPDEVEYLDRGGR